MVFRLHCKMFIYKKKHVHLIGIASLKMKLRVSIEIFWALSLNVLKMWHYLKVKQRCKNITQKVLTQKKCI